MNRVLILGAGRSATSLIKYLLEASVSNDWKVIVADYALQLAEEKVGNHPNGTAIAFNINKEDERDRVVEQADVVISMLPARFHPSVAEACLMFGKHLITASYVSDDMRALDEQANSFITLWWYRIIPHASYMKGWKISPSHYLNQDLSGIWIEK